MGFWKNQDLEIWEFVKLGIWENRNMRSGNLGEQQFWKMGLWENDIVENGIVETLDFGKMQYQEIFENIYKRKFVK